MRRDKNKENQIAQERIGILLGEAENAADRGEQEYADRYVELAWKIKLKYRISLSPEQKSLFCRKCLSFFTPATANYRIKDHAKIIECMRCGNITRIYLENNTSE